MKFSSPILFLFIFLIFSLALVSAGQIGLELQDDTLLAGELSTLTINYINLSENNISLLGDVDSNMAPSENDVLTYLSGEWTNNYINYTSQVFSTYDSRWYQTADFSFSDFAASFDLNTTALQNKVNSSYLSTYNATYDGYATNVSTNWTQQTFNTYDTRWLDGDGDFSFTDFAASFDLNTTALQNKVNSSYLSTFNSTYDNYKTNVSTNWSKLTFDTWDSRWYQIASGDFSFTDFQASFDLNTTDLQNKVNSSYLSTYNATYDNYATNVSNNWTKQTFDTYDSRWLSGGGDFSFTDFFDAFILNMSNTQNQTVLTWNNITNVPDNTNLNHTNTVYNLWNTIWSQDTIFTPTNVAWVNESNTFTPAQTFDNNITVEGIKLEVDPSNHIIKDNSTCIILTGSTSTLNIC